MQFFSQELMGGDLYVSDRSEHPSCFLMCVCTLVHILKKNAIPLSMSWPFRQTDHSSSCRHHAAGPTRPCKAWWFAKGGADTHDHILLFPPDLLSLVCFYAIHEKILSCFLGIPQAFIICLSNSVHLPTHLLPLSQESASNSSREPATLTNFCASPVPSRFLLNIDEMSGKDDSISGHKNFSVVLVRI